MAEVRFGLLGPFEVLVDGRPVQLAGAGERSLLALLLLSPGRPVPATTLIDRIWTETSLPHDPVNALQIRVSRLRRALAASGLPSVERDGVGYRIDVPGDAIDAERFVALLRDARARVSAAAGEHTPEQLAAYDDALGLWRGEALADFAAEAWATPDAVRLTELRLAATAEWAQVALGLGRNADVVSVLEPLVAERPTQESLVGLLMVALYRDGRQAQALEVYTRTRTLLDEELGLEPSASLRTLHEQILRQHEGLGGLATMVVPPAPVTPAPRPEAARSRRERGHLPTVAPGLVGREDDVAALVALLGDARLVTLVGAGGAGKTSLALATASIVAAAYPDGVFVVRLAAVAEESQVALAVADAVGVPLDGASTATDDVSDRIVRFLATRRVLLVVDNCEHVIDAAASLADRLLAECDDLTLLATSREALAVSDELQVLVGPLDVPPPDAPAEEVMGYPAAELFVRRARAVRRDLDLDASDLDALARICRALDGLPLALELAAARASSLALTEIADRLDHRFALLTSGRRTADARQRNLKATVDWSYELLDDTEKLVFERLSVFQGGFGLAAAEQVVATGDLTPARVLDALARLVAQSLVTATPGRPTRYWMLETLREYAAGKLDLRGERDRLATAHARHFSDVVVAAAQELRGPGQRDALTLLRAEHGNIRAALGHLARPDGDHDAALTLAGHLGLFWHQGRHLEGRAVLDGLLAAGAGSGPARALALQAVSLVARPRACLVHPSPRCADAAHESLELFRAIGDDRGSALSRLLLAVEGVVTQDAASAGLLGEAEEQFRRDGDQWGVAVAGFVRTERALKAGDAELATQTGRAAAAAFRQLDDLWGLSAVLYHLGWGLRQFGRLEESVATLVEAVDVAAGAGLDNTVQWALGDLGIAHVCRGDLDAARDAFDRSARASVRVGDGAGEALAAYGDGLLAQLGGDWPSALERFESAERAFERLHTPMMQGYAELGAARARTELGDAEAAEKLFRSVMEFEATVGEPALRAGALEGLAVFHPDRAGELRAEARSIRDRTLRPATRFDLAP